MVPDECILRNMDSSQTNSTDAPKVDAVLEENPPAQVDGVERQNEVNNKEEESSSSSGSAEKDLTLGNGEDKEAENKDTHDGGGIKNGTAVDEEHRGEEESQDDADNTNTPTVGAPDKASDTNCLPSLPKNNVVDSNVSTATDSPNVVLRIPQARLASNSESVFSESDSPVQNGPDDASVSNSDQPKNLVNTDTPAEDHQPKSGISSRRASYIDVVGLSDDPAEVPSANGTSAAPDNPMDTAVEEAEDKDFSEDEDKLVINEGGAERKAPDEEEVVTIGQLNFCGHLKKCV